MSIQSDVSLFMFICASQKQRNGKVRYTYMKLRLYPCWITLKLEVHNNWILKYNKVKYR